jgi:aminoglycoside phosphotransferase
MPSSDHLPSVEDVHASKDVLYSMGTGTVAGMGPHLVVKYGERVRLSEAEAMRYIAENTNTPVPAVQKAFVQEGKTYIYMTRIPGRCLEECLDNFSDPQVERIVEQVADYVNEMRNLNGNGYIGSMNHGPCTDYFWQYNDELPAGPFDTETQFNDLIASAYHHRWGESRPKFHTFLRSLYRDNHHIVFTHGDIAPRNIMVSDEGHITGIIDWEYAGWYPEYWEYAKAHFGGDWRTNWILWVDKYFPSYHYELLVHNIAYRALT